MKGSITAESPAPPGRAWGMDPEETSQTASGEAATWFVGTRAVPATFISRVYRLRSKPAPNSKPGKK